MGGVEACAVDGDLERLRANLAGAAGHELVEGLAGVDAGVDGEAGGVEFLLLLGHGGALVWCGSGPRSPGWATGQSAPGGIA